MNLYYSIDTYQYCTYPGLIPENYYMDVVILCENNVSWDVEQIYYFDTTDILFWQIHYRNLLCSALMKP